MIESFHNAVRFFIIFVSVGIGAIVIIMVIKSISAYADRRERQVQETAEKKEYNERRRNNEIKLEQRRDYYWQNLSAVYGDKDRQTLEEVLPWLEDFQLIWDSNESFASNERWECRENIKRILDNPRWEITEGEFVDSPIWLDLDIKFVNLMLN